MTSGIQKAMAVMCLSAALAPSARAQDMASLFSARRIDFGVIATGSDARKLVRVRNTLPNTIHISNVRTTCGCSAARPSRYTIEPNQQAEIEVTMDTLKFKHQKDSNLIVEFDAPRVTSVRLPITAYIRTDVVLSPGSADFGKVEAGRGAQRTIRIEYAGRSDWQIRGVKTGTDRISARVVEMRRSAGQVAYELEVRIDPSVRSGRLRDLVTLVTDDASNPHVPVLVEADVESDITVTPSSISLGMLTPGQSRTVRVVLRGKRPFEVERIECQDHPESFQVQLPKTRRNVQIVPLRVTMPETPGRFADEFTVTIAGRSEPLTFRASGTVRNP